jgi:hypothetical protein
MVLGVPHKDSFSILVDLVLVQVSVVSRFSLSPCHHQEIPTLCLGLGDFFGAMDILSLRAL